MERVRAYYSGDVQGVGFRFTAVAIAKRLKIVGWIKNCADGRVEIVAEAKKPALDSFFNSIKKCMEFHLRDMSLSNEPATSEFSDFKIRY